MKKIFDSIIEAKKDEQALLLCIYIHIAPFHDSSLQLYAHLLLENPLSQI